MDATVELRRRGGVARVQTLHEAGVTAHALRMARHRGEVRTVRRGWVAVPDADAMLVAAAHRGVVLTCITLAARRGLWVLDADRVHVAAPPNAGHAGATKGTVHWCRPVFPRHPDSCEDSLENALIIAARCQPYEAALAMWESALRQGLVDPQALRRAPLPPAARHMLADARPFADAGTETIFLTRLRWMKLRLLPQAWILGRPVDCLIGERLIVQIDGGHHVGEQRTKDIEHDAQLKLHGYHVIRISYDQLINRWHDVQELIMAAVAQGLHLA